MQRIPEETIQQVLAATDIVALIGRYVTLKRKGVDFWGLCPFHTEKSGSFKVSATHHNYHCFGCGAGGTAIRFLMEHDGLAFGEAVRRLAEAAGIRLETEVWDAEAEREAKHRSLLKKVHEDIAEWFHALLLRHEVADAARQYLKSRGITSAVAKNWQLGYAPEQGMMVRRWASEHQYSEQVLVDAGIYKRADDGRAYPGFRHRLMFPIRGENGDVIAFSGRLLDPNAKTAKYLNSPETPLFSKSKVLFGFDKSKRAIAKADCAIVCEGQVDLIMAFEAGIHNVCAPLGTAFTEFHAKLLKRTCDEVILCYDSDNAGVKAAERSYQILSPAGLVVKVAALPKGEDPDSMIRKQGVEAFQETLAKAVDFLDFQIGHKKASGGGELRNQVQLIEQTAVTIAMNPSVATRDLLIRSHAAQLGLTEDAFRKQVNLFIVRRQKDAERRATQEAGKEQEARADSPVEAGRKLIAGQHRTALMLCCLALTKPEVLKWLRTIDIEPLLHELPGCELLGRIWHAHFDAGDEAALGSFFATLPAEEESAFMQLRARPMLQGDVKEAMDAMRGLDLARLHHLIQQTQVQMRRPDLTPEQIGELHAQVMQWRKEYLDQTQRS
jgi:DNA primase